MMNRKQWTDSFYRFSRKLEGRVFCSVRNKACGRPAHGLRGSQHRLYSPNLRGAASKLSVTRTRKKKKSFRWRSLPFRGTVCRTYVNKRKTQNTKASRNKRWPLNSSKQQQQKSIKFTHRKKKTKERRHTKTTLCFFCSLRVTHMKKADAPPPPKKKKKKKAQPDRPTNKHTKQRKKTHRKKQDTHKRRFAFSAP